ncbi:MAG: ankyrin repeat domain-containing protein [Planctomycetota bacterium]
MNKRATAWVFFVMGLCGAPISRAHETDQYTVPVGRQYADLRHYFSDDFRGILERATEKTNAKIAHSFRNGHSTAETARLQSPDSIAWAVLYEFPPVIFHVETLEMRLRNPVMRSRFPGLLTIFQPQIRIYDHVGLLLDPTKLIRLGRSSTVMINGTFLGTDKIVHFAHMGYIYFSTYRKAISEGLDEAQAMERVRKVATGDHPLSENAFLGRITTGVRSNGDLAANFMGLRFYQNLTEAVRLHGIVTPPLLVQDGEFWRLNDYVLTDPDFFALFVSDHWDEVLNPNQYDPQVLLWIPSSIRWRCEDLRSWYLNARGQRQTKKDFNDIAVDLSTYFGEDYFHGGDPEELIGVATCCYSEEGSNQPDGSRSDPALAQTPHQELRGTNGEANAPAPVRNVDARDRFGRTELWHAASRGDIDTVRDLLDAKADVNASDMDGDQPLHAAARWSRANVVEVLLAHGANANARNALGATPLHFAARERAGAVVQTLLAYDADVRLRDQFGCTVLHDAVDRGDTELAEMLIAKGANIDEPDDSGTTPMHRAARAGHEGTVAFLLSAGAIPSLRNQAGRTPKDEAVLNAHTTIVQRLLKAESSRQHVRKENTGYDKNNKLVSEPARH